MLARMSNFLSSLADQSSATNWDRIMTVTGEFIIFAFMLVWIKSHRGDSNLKTIKVYFSEIYILNHLDLIILFYFLFVIIFIPRKSVHSLGAGTLYS